MVRSIVLALSLATALSAAPAHADDRRFDVGRFSAIELSASDQVRVVPGDIAVTASGDPKALAALQIEVRDDTLHVDRRPGSWRDRGAIVTVSVPALRAASIQGSGGIRIAAVTGPRFAGSVSGSGTLSLPRLDASRVSLEVGGSGSIVAVGTADMAAIQVGGSGNVDARGLRTRDLTVGVGGSGDVSATASGTATVGVGGSGSVRVTGGASCTVSRGGSGSVHCG